MRRPEIYQQGGGKPNGWQTARCTSVTEDRYKATADDEDLGLDFVEGLTYMGTDTKFWEETMSQPNMGKAKRAGQDSKHHH